MSRSLWRCRNRNCPVTHGAVLGRLTADGGLVLDPAVMAFRVYLDTRRAVVSCPECGTAREFRGGVVISAATSRERWRAPGCVSIYVIGGVQNNAITVLESTVRANA